MLTEYFEQPADSSAAPELNSTRPMTSSGRGESLR